MNAPVTEPDDKAPDTAVESGDSQTKIPPPAKAMDITAYGAVSPDVMMRSFLYKGDGRVGIFFGHENFTLVFSDAHDLWRLRGAVDEAIQMLEGQIAYLDSLGMHES